MIYAFSQSGSVTGQVTDAETGETLIGASILIQGTSRGTITDLDGNYALSNIKPGPYNIVVSYISYDNRIIMAEVASGESLVLNVALKPATIGVEEVTIVRRRRTDTEKALIASLKSGDLIANAISASSIPVSLQANKN